ncbi:response regulator [Paenibacillus sp. HJGM_3]|uniref:response regulator n=1 Tax=Paenibacillus sp. HJGM_3 TaxID=3379816 RepID=UPI003858C8C4
MYQLLIVDDEPSVVNTIAHTMPWEELEVDEVLRAYSGQEALELVKRHVVDILITDIRMPGLDGIQLVEQIRKFSKQTQVIFLTGYGEFEYAKRALQLEAADYLLKPVSDESLIHSVSAVIRKLKREEEKAELYERAALLLQEHQPALKAEMLVQVLEGGRLDAQESLAMIGVPFASGDLATLVLIRLEGSFSRFNRRDRLLMEYSIFNMAEETFSPYFAVWTCRDRHEFLVLALKPRIDPDAEDGPQLLPRLCGQLQHNVMRYLNGDISLAIGSPSRFPEEIAASYQSALLLMRRRLGKDIGLIMKADDPLEKQDVPSLKALHEPPSLNHLLEEGRWEEAGMKLEMSFEELDQVWNDSPELLTELYHAIAFGCYRYAHANGETLTRLMERIGEPEGLPELRALLSVHRMKEWALGLCRQLSCEKTEDTRSSRASVVAHVKAYIHEHLADDVSLHVLADQVGLHPVYLSKVFKLETGEGLKEYLHQVRMEKAVRLLKHSDHKIYEITAEVGYLNTPYFIKVFKKEFGQTPQEYRDHYAMTKG